MDLFFNTNQAKLLQSYPGLQLTRLYKVVEELSPFRDFTSEKLQDLKKLLLSGIPLQYISQNAFFYKSSFYVDEGVLIPRSESEILVEKMVQLIRDNPMFNSIVEIGVGSGALLLSILADSDRALSAVGTDISFEALEVAQKNTFLVMSTTRMNILTSIIVVILTYYGKPTLPNYS